MEMQVRLRKFDLLKYNYLHIWWLLAIDFMGLIFFFILANIAVNNPSPGIRETAGIILFWFVLLLAFGFSQPLILFSQIFIFKMPQVQQQLAPRKYLFKYNAIEIESEQRSVSIGWDRIIKIRRIMGLFLLYTSPKLAYVIPQRMFDNKTQMEDFFSLVTGKIKSRPIKDGFQNKRNQT